MSKIPYTGKTPGARQPQQPVSADPLATESYSPQHPMLEDPDALAVRLVETEDFLRRKKGILLGLLIALVLAVVGALAFFTWRSSQDSKAQAAMFQAVNYWEADSLKKAMKGDGQYVGLESVANEYGGTDAGNLANFYAGVAALKQGQYKAASDYLEDFSSKDLLIQARAYALLGDANLEQNKYKEAADFYEKAANHNANEQFTPGYLMKQATALELSKNYDGAVKAYDRILTEYPNSFEVNEARQYKARAEGMTASK
ncbi:tetratricopeptide repeat protein [Hymenobacter tibetensis]|uniref:Tetratricopeptide repeat protein n=1 Tax=Hymenobacter tibetensis TaxID=497967 RepID=A0ABY4CXK3_9BACT|nr:tetratricopeptide repeat protein [Hymenobacter tibetensis]UOG75003.1 tetratricopeptide repeat protein [Hymenobacter tibetensis]